MTEFVCSDGTRLPVQPRLSKKAKRLRLSLKHTGALEVVIPERLKRLYLPTNERSGVGFGGRQGAHTGGRPKAATGGRPDAADGGISDATSGRLPGAEADGWQDAVENVQFAEFVEQHRAWIERAAKRTRIQREAYLESKAAGLPTHLDFPPVSEIWLIEYVSTKAGSVSVRPDGLRRLDGAKKVFALKLIGRIEDDELCKRALRRFVKQRANELIPGFALAICREIGATPRSVSVNDRKSAWGQCNQGGDIKIDQKVLFFPADMARQVVLHEAAHLKHLDHSARFYAELFSYEGSTKEAEQAVKKAVRLIPAWALNTV